MAVLVGGFAIDSFASQPVWYVAFGSNLLEARFLCYLRGGTFDRQPVVRRYRGCRDRTLPTGSRAFALSHALRFGKRSTSWGGGGVAFVDRQTSDVVTRGRAWRLRFDQLEDVFAQENDRDPVPLPAACLTTFREVGDGWYRWIFPVGEVDGEPAVTITGPLGPAEVRAPDASYVGVIREGLAQTYPGESPDVLDGYLAARIAVGND